MRIRQSGFSAMAFVLLSAMWCLPAKAEIAFDTQVELLPGGDITTPGGESRWRLTITNTGNEPIFVPVAGTEFIEEGPGKTFHLYPIAETTPCVIHYTDFWFPQTQQVSFTATIFFGDDPLAPGASTSCIVGVTIDPEAPPVFTMGIPFGAHNEDFSVIEREFIPITFVLSTLPKPIPVPALSYWALVAMIAGFSVSTSTALKTVKP